MWGLSLQSLGSPGTSGCPMGKRREIRKADRGWGTPILSVEGPALLVSSHLRLHVNRVLLLLFKVSGRTQLGTVF